MDRKRLSLIPGSVIKSLLLETGSYPSFFWSIIWLKEDRSGTYLEFVQKCQNSGLKSNTNVSISSEFELWLQVEYLNKSLIFIPG